MTTLLQHLSVPYTAEFRTVQTDDGEWTRQASYIELPDCVVTGDSVVDDLDQLERLRISIILRLIREGRPPPLARAPLSAESIKAAVQRGEIDIPTEWLDLDESELAEI